MTDSLAASMNNKISFLRWWNTDTHPPGKHRGQMVFVKCKTARLASKEQVHLYPDKYPMWAELPSMPDKNSVTADDLYKAVSSLFLVAAQVQGGFLTDTLSFFGSDEVDVDGVAKMLDEARERLEENLKGT